MPKKSLRDWEVLIRQYEDTIAQINAQRLKLLSAAENARTAEALRSTSDNLAATRQLLESARSSLESERRAQR